MSKIISPGSMLSLSKNILSRLAHHQPARKALFSTTSFLRDSEDPMRECGDWPRTKEERERAAKKYNLIPEDYEPYPENEGMGDYPNLKCIGAYNKDWYADYDDILEHRYYGEPIELDADLYYWERIDPLAHEKPAQIPMRTQAFCFFLMATVPFALYFFFTETRPGRKIHLNHRYKFKEVNPPGTKFYWFPTREEPHHHH